MQELNDYIYSEPLKQRHKDIERLKELGALDTNDKEVGTEFLQVVNRLFYNSFDKEAIIEQQALFTKFLEIELDDSSIPEAFSGTNKPEHQELINEIADALEFGESLRPFKLNKLAQLHPDVSFFQLMAIIEMEQAKKDPNKILKRIKDLCSIYPNNSLFALFHDQYCAINDKDGTVINADTFAQSSLAGLMNNRSRIHPIEFYIAHAALFEYLIKEDNILHTDAFIAASMQLFPELEEVLTEKAMLLEFHKLDYCIEKYAPELA